MNFAERLRAHVRVLFDGRSLVWHLAVHEFRERYAATFAGSLWAVVEPALLFLVLWFVFAYGFRIETPDGATPYFLVLFCGLVPWTTFRDAVSGGTNVLLRHQHLIRRGAFPTQVLPLAHLLAALLPHGVMVGFLLVVLAANGIWPSLGTLQVLYYLAAMYAFALGLAWLLGALNLFFRDVGQALGPAMTFWFWLTPIVWPAENPPPWARAVLELNPMFYVVEGYRSAFLDRPPLWQDLGLTLYFWLVVAAVVAAGTFVFRRLKPHFAEVL